MSNVRLLAKDRCVSVIEEIVNGEFDSEDGREAIIGYLWGGHEDIVKPIYDKYQNRIFREMLIGRALARNILGVNELIAGGHDEPATLYACQGYLAGGHLVNAEKGQELIALTTSLLLRSRLQCEFDGIHSEEQPSLVADFARLNYHPKAAPESDKEPKIEAVTSPPIHTEPRA